MRIAGEVIPVEVKKGKRTKSTSLNMFIKQYKSKYAIRISGRNFGFENPVKSALTYAIRCSRPEEVSVSKTSIISNSFAAKKLSG